MGTYDPAVAGDRVTADNRAAGRIAARHLRALGHRRIAFFGPGAARIAQNTSLRDPAPATARPWSGRPPAVGPPAGEETAALEALEPLEPLEPLELLDALPEALDDQRRLRRLLEFLDRSGATAAVTCNDALAALLMRYLRSGGLRVPEHLALVGISDARLASVIEVPLTTVRLDAHGMGAAAAGVLLRRLEGDGSPPGRVILPVQLVVRASCGARTSHDAPTPTSPPTPRRTRWWPCSPRWTADRTARRLAGSSEQDPAVTAVRAVTAVTAVRAGGGQRAHRGANGTASGSWTSRCHCSREAPSRRRCPAWAGSAERSVSSQGSCCRSNSCRASLPVPGRSAER